MSKYILTIEDPHKNNAGPKAKEDVLHFLKAKDYRSLPLNIDLDPTNRGILAKIRKVYDAKFVIPRALKKVDADTIIIQYPIYSTYLTTNLIEAIRKYTKAKLYLVIHDVETLRLFSDDEAFVQSELAIFNEVDGIVLHNKRMQAWFDEQNIKTPCVDLQIFDYYNPGELVTAYNFDKSVVFAGNLEKSKFLTAQGFDKLGFELTLFGPNPAENYASNIDYRGIKTPEELPKYLDQNFGLVWDGNSLTECDGVFGEYTKYNNPHKASLYLSSGLPLIVWKQSALADFVEDKKVGFAVDELSQVKERLETMSAKEYAEMKENTLTLAESLRNGDYIKAAVSRLEQVGR